MTEGEIHLRGGGLCGNRKFHSGKFSVTMLFTRPLEGFSSTLRKSELTRANMNLFAAGELKMSLTEIIIR